MAIVAVVYGGGDPSEGRLQIVIRDAEVMADLLEALRQLGSTSPLNHEQPGSHGTRVVAQPLDRASGHEPGSILGARHRVSTQPAAPLAAASRSENLPQPETQEAVGLGVMLEEVEAAPRVDPAVEHVARARSVLHQIYVDDKIKDYIVAIAAKTRTSAQVRSQCSSSETAASVELYSVSS